ncbi:MAG: polysulfide reductase NrfD [candidate division Zixibacteria bacterium]|nr:polysulfide reductase NrfD [candidate division Zixibacteria bacterium]
MIEKALYGDKKYWGWLILLGAVIGVGTFFYLRQFSEGLGITGLSRDVTWGFYIAQFTFLVGVAASAVMVVLPYYLHNYKAFGKITILGEFLAIGSVTMCMLFIFVDMGQPFRILNVFLHPSPSSPMFWDTIALSGYLGINALVAAVTLSAERKAVAPPKWIKPIIILSIPWAVSIHTVTAFLYAGLVARPFWMTAVLAPRFLASAFAAGPALLILLCLLLKKLTKFDVGKEPIEKLAVITTYAMCINVFLVLMELFTGLYSDIPEHVSHFQYMFMGIGEHTFLMPWMWASIILAVFSLVMLLVPKLRRNHTVLAVASVAVFMSLWIDKGMGLIITGFVPNPMGAVVEYSPTMPEVMITLGVYAVGALLVTVLYKIALGVRRQLLDH